jgi:hypothetical protein
MTTRVKPPDHPHACGEEVLRASPGSFLGGSPPEDLTMTVIDDLLKTAFSRRKASTDAIGALGLLLEETRAKRPVGDDGGIRDLLGPELAAYRLSKVERSTIIESLSHRLLKQRNINHLLIWALSKSADECILPVLTTVLNRALQSPQQQDAASEALNGLALFWPDSKSAVERAAQQGQGDVQEQAEDLLKRHSLYESSS